MGIWIPGDPRQAEAIIGGFGNVTASNHPHNFAYGSSGAAAYDSNETRVCVFCHTPHVSDTSAAILNAPLWNHTLSSSVTYSVKSPGAYSGSPLSGNVNLVATPLSTPDGDSRLCLSCHDGTVSVGNVRSEAAAGGIPMDSSSACIDTSGKMPNSGCSAYVGTNLTQKHVVSIPMNNGLITAHNALCGSNGQTTELQYPWQTGYGDTIFLRPTTATYGGSSGIDGSGARSGCGGDLQCEKNYGDGYNYGVQCSTCHDPHYWAESVSSNTEGYMMLVAGINTLCSACHTATCP